MASLKLNLMKHDFNVPCAEEDKAQLIEAATLIEDKLDQVTGLKGEKKVLSVALNLAYDYLQMQKETTQYTLRLEDQIEEVMTQVTNDQ